MTHDLSHISPVWGRLTHLVIERGEGCYVYTTDGEQSAALMAATRWAARRLKPHSG